jgi:hypothetical protein
MRHGLLRRQPYSRYSDIAEQVAHAWAWRQGAAKTWKRMQV